MNLSRVVGVHGRRGRLHEFDSMFGKAFFRGLFAFFLYLVLLSFHLMLFKCTFVGWFSCMLSRVFLSVMLKMGLLHYLPQSC